MLELVSKQLEGITEYYCYAGRCSNVYSGEKRKGIFFSGTVFYWFRRKERGSRVHVDAILFLFPNFFLAQFYSLSGGRGDQEFRRMKGEEGNAEVMDTSVEATNDEDDRKLFVGGLPQDAKDCDIKEHFEGFGEIESINIKTDPQTGRSRGFAFVVFKSLEGLEKAVSAEHTVKSKKVAVKKAQAKQGKVYVGKLKPEISDEDIKTHFSQYGPVANVEQPFDKTKNERKNFCFITFEKEEPAKKLLKEGTVTLKGAELEIKKVTPKPDIRGMVGHGVPVDHGVLDTMIIGDPAMAAMVQILTMGVGADTDGGGYNNAGSPGFAGDG
ncbi:SQD [Lepeophtheirus salmonis]|uniref:SQD n=1 Tax=Lepeophtheirus salmonis TaxID=72036 RepID=A0A7R8H5Z7_LEPSM|nr:SQD [Lepeophtheirus salmonis]CAF2887481.1 SQD [Lepeophtheirus salmonis]